MITNLYNKCYFSFLKTTPPTIGDITPVETSSIKKFQPMKPTNKKTQIFGKAPLVTLASKIGRKKIRAMIMKIPVLIIGTNKLAIIKARIVFFFLIALNAKPDTKPASVHFKRQASIVPTRLTGMKTAIVDGDNKAMIPLKKPTIAPDNGQPNTAARTTATKEMLMLTGPNCR